MELLESIKKNKLANYKKAQELYKEGLYSNALVYFFRALNAIELLNNQIDEVDVKKWIMFCYSANCEYDQVLLYSDDLLNNYRLDSEQHELICTTKAFALNRMGQFAAAEKILKELINSDSKKVRFRANTDLGLLYYFLHRFSENELLDLALECFKAAHQSATAVDQNSLYKSLSNLGLLYLEKEEIDLALTTFLESLDYAKSEHERAQVYNELGRVYALQGNLDKSEEYLEKAASFSLMNNKLLTLTYNIYYRGLIQIQLRKINNAFTYLHTALYSFLERKHYPEVVVIYKQLSELFSENNPQRAEYFLNEYHHFLNYIDPIDLENSDP